MSVIEQAPERASKGSRDWNYRPELPLKVSPLFTWPPDPVRIALWFWNSWFLISERLILVGIAFATWAYTQPALERCRDFEIGWVAQVWARNFALMALVAGALHLYFYTYRKQGDVRKFDARPLKKNSRAFTLRSQLLDNMFWTLGSGVAAWSAYDVLMMWAFANGYLPAVTWQASPVWFVALFFFIPIWETFYFYLIHRALHWPPLYRVAHALHHRNTNIGPWSGLSMHPIEHVMYFGSVLIHWVVAAHPVHVLYHLQYFALTAATSHTGFEGLLVKDKSRLHLGNFHHQMHHRYFECNYGGLEIPWDKWMGSFHDGTAEAHERIKERRRRMAGGS